jgi:hypothetical protein
MAGALASCGILTSITLPDSVTSIGDWAFESGTNLAKVTIPASVYLIGDRAFESCPSLTGVYFKGNSPSLGGSEVFSGADKATVYYLSGATGWGSTYGGRPTALWDPLAEPFNYTTTNGKVTITGYTGTGGAVVIPSTIDGLPVTGIGEWAFSGSTSLTSVTIPDSVTTIESSAFRYCHGLTSISIPNSVTLIGDEAFGVCYGLTSVSIPNSVTSIGRSTFAGCRGLISVSIPNSVTSIGDYAFESCYRLTSVTIPNSVTSIGIYAFAGCSGLTSLSIGSGVTSIGHSAFSTCEGLTEAVFLGNAPSIGLGVFSLTAYGFTIYYYDGKTGFTSPTWMGYPSVAIGTVSAPEIAVEQPVGTNLAAGSASVNFSSVALGANVVKTVTIKNTGNANLTGLALSKGGSHAADFIVTAPLQTTLAPGTATTFSVTFKPTAAGIRTAAIQLASNDADENPFDITLTGTGVPSPEIAIQQPAGTDLKDGISTKSFGSVALKSTGTKTFTIKNTGTANLTGLAITKNGANAKNFTVKAPLKTTLAPGASTTFKVIFKPTAKGIRKAAIHIKSNDSNESPFDIALTGKGTISAAAPSAVAKSAHLPARPGHGIRQTSSTVRLADGRKYLTLTVMKSPGDTLLDTTVEVSPNLIDWFSGSKHTTVIADDATRLKVRDNTPLTPEAKRYIRLKKARN